MKYLVICKEKQAALELSRRLMASGFEVLGTGDELDMIVTVFHDHSGMQETIGQFCRKFNTSVKVMYEVTS